MSEQTATQAVELTPELEAVVKRELARRQKAKEKSQANVRAKYPWADADRARYNDRLDRYEYPVQCKTCGQEHWRAAQDLFQTLGYCDECQKEAKKAKSKTKKELMAQALKLIAEGKISLPAEEIAEEQETEEEGE